MQRGLGGLKIAILATDGVEEVELTEPRRALEEAGAEVHLVAPEEGEIQAMRHDEKGERLKVDRVLASVQAQDYAGLVLPGGVVNPDTLRTNKAAVSFVRGFVEADKPIAAICHGPWLLVEAGAVRGRTLTSWPSLKTDIVNAGGEWVDEAVATDQKLVTSRKPDDLPQFCSKIVAVFGPAAEERSLDRMVEQTFPASDPLPGPISGGASRREEAPPPM